jgi:branched-chain amino acid transport system permease protein
MTIAAALFFDNSIFSQIGVSHGAALTVQDKWVGLGILNADGHHLFIMLIIVLVICVAAVTLVGNGTTGRFLAAQRGSETAAAGIGINITWQRIQIFALSGAVAGIGGTMLVIQQQTVNAMQFNYQLGLAFVVIVITTGVSSLEGAIQAGMGYVVVQQILTYLPARYGGNGLTFVLFAAGALTYVAHPEGILEYQKRRWTMRFQRLIYPDGPSSGGPTPPSAGSGNGAKPPVGVPSLGGGYSGVATESGAGHAGT